MVCGPGRLHGASALFITDKSSLEELIETAQAFISAELNALKEKVCIWHHGLDPVLFLLLL